MYSREEWCELVDRVGKMPSIETGPIQFSEGPDRRNRAEEGTFLPFSPGAETLLFLPLDIRTSGSFYTENYTIRFPGSEVSGCGLSHTPGIPGAPACRQPAPRLFTP